MGSAANVELPVEACIDTLMQTKLVSIAVKV